MTSNMSTFHTWWKAEHAKKMGVSVATVNTRWDQGDRKLDTTKAPAAAAGYWDFTTDFCSSSPDTATHFNFKHSCSRHDYGWRNLKKMHGRWGNVNTVANRQYVNILFGNDMYAHCRTRSIFLQTACNNTATVYVAVVGVAGVM